MLTAASPLVGQGRFPERAGPFTTRDSAGIRIVEHESYLNAPIAFRVERTPFLSLGGLAANADDELNAYHPYLSATELNNGLVVVNDATKLRFYNRGGQLVRTVGARGSGPGEFDQTGFVCRLHGDTLLVVDGANGRVSLWDGVGNFVRSVPRPGFVLSGACWPDGSLLVQEVGNAKRNDSGELLLSYLRQKLDSKSIGSYGRFMRSRYFGQVFFETWLVPRGDDLIVGESEGFEVRRHRLDGSLHTISRVREVPREITDAEWRRMTNDEIPLTFVGAARAQELSRLLTRPRPETYPPHARIRVDPAHRVWIEDFHQRHIQYVLDSTGILLGRVDAGSAVRTSGRITVVAVGAVHIVLRWHDSDGAVHLTFHRLLPS